MRSRPETTRTSRRAGFTAVELLVAVALASLLMIAVMEILGLLSARRRVLVEESDFAAWHRPLIDQLRWDLANARRFELSPGRLRLLGYGGRDFATRRPTCRPTEVRYELLEVDGNSWLVRNEYALDSLSNANRRSELVCCGRCEISMDIPGQPDQNPRRSGEIPECFRLAIRDDSGAEPVVEMFYCR